ncbi:hypothetical protein OTB20_35970 [Streptomyces sp. H27-H1]|uniref:hypothetical protein n=1 Tax=Streptomyces sp. H27-H1 TaxID=2996461 RepID=UPI0022704FFB|nr:hypothetical protein [Streptomyces sp. H27-H1]MCY0931490.1 hypothetical protein [Streptomyces sp. H27-H1]
MSGLWRQVLAALGNDGPHEQHERAGLPALGAAALAPATSRPPPRLCSASRWPSSRCCSTSRQARAALVQRRTGRR